MSSFEKWANFFSKQNLYAFNNDENGILWLKTRAICRTKQINNFLKINSIHLSSKKLKDQFVELFKILEYTPNAMELLDEYLTDINNEWYELLGVDEQSLKEDLYKVRYYTWGGDQNNSLDKYLVKHYVKSISSFDELQSKKIEIAENTWNYVLNSWYNNWTSYLVEALFKRNKNVVSAIGEIKSVDFFINDFPFDLKITFFPAQFMQQKLKEYLGKNELSWLRQKSKESGLTYYKNFSANQQIYTLAERLSDLGHNDILDELNDAKRMIVNESAAHPEELLTWLYTNQGSMRFGAENRLFLLLIDTNNYEQSWKMKRAFDLIEPAVTKYLNNFASNNLKPIDFVFEGNPYKSLADVIFIIK